MKKSTFSLVMFNFCVIVILGILFFMMIVINEKLEKQNINIEKNEKKYNELQTELNLLHKNFEKFKEEQTSNYDFQMQLNDIMLDRIYNLEGLDNNYCKKYEK